MNLVPSGEGAIPKAFSLPLPGMWEEAGEKRRFRNYIGRGRWYQPQYLFISFFALLFISISSDFGFQICFSLCKLAFEIIIWPICLHLSNECKLAFVLNFRCFSFDVTVHRLQQFGHGSEFFAAKNREACCFESFFFQMNVHFSIKEFSVFHRFGLPLILCFLSFLFHSFLSCSPTLMLSCFFSYPPLQGTQDKPLSVPFSN